MPRRRRTNGLDQVQKVQRVPCPPQIGRLIGCGADKGAPCVDPNGKPRESNHQARIKAHKIAFPAVESVHIGTSGARDHYGREHAATPSGAAYGGPCPRCDESLSVGSGIVKTSRGWIHRACAPGAEE